MKTFIMPNPHIKGQPILLLSTNRGIELIDISSIVRIEANSNYSKLFFTNNKTPLVTAKVLRWFEEQLSVNMQGFEFLRVHRKHLVNNTFIQGYQAGKIRLINGEYIDVAKRKKAYFLKWWLNKLNAFAGSVHPLLRKTG